jgi:branched-chain amino acid transport system ATP-binding protein
MTALLTLDAVSRRFGALRAVDDVTMTVAAGARHAVIGPNGAGKTTLFSLIAGTLSVTSGKILFDGAEITSVAEPSRVKRGIARTFQQSSLFTSMPVLDNVALAVQRAGGGSADLRPWRRRQGVGRARALLEAVGLAGRERGRVSSLSHGERRQLEVAVALACSPRLLMLDEPTAGMSTYESGRFADLIESLPADITVLLIEHDLDVVFRLARTVTVLHLGRVLADGAADAVRDDPAVQHAYLGTARHEELFLEPG